MAIQCHECHAEVASGEMYCPQCGTEIRLDHDEVHTAVSEEIKEHKEKTTEEQMRQMLLWMAFFMLFFWTLDCQLSRDLIGDVPDESYHIPVYSTQNELVPPVIFEDRSLDTHKEIEQLIEKNRDIK